MISRKFFALFFCFWASFAFAGDAMKFAVDAEMLIINTPKGAFTYELEIADTDLERAAGLMFRQDFPKSRAMLFDFGESRAVSMWMKNTPLPLDMLFIDASGLVIGVAEDTVPESLDVISAPAPVRYVLEINAGQAAQKGIAAGARLSHPLIKP